MHYPTLTFQLHGNVSMERNNDKPYHAVDIGLLYLSFKIVIYPDFQDYLQTGIIRTVLLVLLKFSCCSEINSKLQLILI